MRGQNFLDYSIPSGTRFFNIFHLYDPVAYRIEPLMGDKYEALNPVLLQRPTSRNRPTFSYYKEQFTSYMASTTFPTQFTDISLKLPSLPSISLPHIPGLEMAKETLNKQFTAMIDSITNYSTMFGSTGISPRNLKRKREESAESDVVSQDTGNGSASHYRVIKKPTSHLKQPHLFENDRQENETSSGSNMDSTDLDTTKTLSTTSQISLLNGAYAAVMQQTVSNVLNRIVTPVMEKIPSIANRLSPVPDLAVKGESSSGSQGNETNHLAEIPPEIVHKRFDYYIQESLIDNNVHQVNIFKILILVSSWTSFSLQLLVEQGNSLLCY